jgi:hypothetical protein
MSLIDEALKRAELEAARRDGLRGGPYPWILEKQPRKGRRWTRFVGIAVVAAAAVGAAVWLLRKPAEVPGPSSQVPGSAGAAPESKIQNPKSKIEMETVEVPPPPKSQPLRAPAAGKTEPKAEKSDSPLPRSPSAAAEGSQSRSATEAPARSSSPAEPRSGGPATKPNPPARGLADGRTYAGEVQLPEGGTIALEGIVYSETNPVALINGKVLPPGGVVEEFSIVSIREDRVELRKQGLTIFITLK